jgi:hypothetical protein
MTLYEVLEGHDVVPSAFDREQHGLWDFIESGSFGDMRVKSQDHANPNRRLRHRSNKFTELVIGRAPIHEQCPTSVLRATEFRHQCHRKVEFMCSLRSVE